MNAAFTPKTNTTPDPFGPARAVLAAAHKRGAPHLRARLLDFSNALRAPGKPVPAASVAAAATRYMDAAAARAASELAVLIDNNPKWREPLYHNTPHYLEVAVTALALAQVEANAASPLLAGRAMPLSLSTVDIGDCFVAGLAHDLKHPGGNNGGVRFLLEEKSWEQLKPILQRANYSDARQRRIYMMLLGTEPGCGAAAVELAMRYHGSVENERAGYFLEMTRLVGKQKDRTFDNLVRSLQTNVKLTVMSYMLNKSDLAFSLMPETYPGRVRDLQNEYRAAGLDIPLLDTNEMPLKDSAEFFFGKIAHVTDKPFLLNSVENTLGKSARAARAIGLGESAPARPAPQSDAPKFKR